jgi:hypothetical protein
MQESGGGARLLRVGRLRRRRDVVPGYGGADWMVALALT